MKLKLWELEEKSTAKQEVKVECEQEQKLSLIKLRKIKFHIYTKIATKLH